jgi:hypothetical protein
MIKINLKIFKDKENNIAREANRCNTPLESAFGGPKQVERGQVAADSCLKWQAASPPAGILQGAANRNRARCAVFKVCIELKRSTVLMIFTETRGQSCTEEDY